MKILVCGADGFLGRSVVRALTGQGHVVLRGVRRPVLQGDIAIDYRRDLTPAAWLPRLQGVDAVVNAVGILHESEAGDFERIHHLAPAALFQACAEAGIRRVVQISALGRGERPYLSSKHAADAELQRCLPEGVALRPGLIYGRDGASSRFFLTLSSLPVHAVPQGAGRLQPVHVDDVVAVVLRLLGEAPVAGGILELPGPVELDYAGWLAGYRDGLGLVPALRLPVPAWTMTLLAQFAGRLPGSLLSPDTWAMLRAGNTGNPAAAATLLGRPLRTPSTFIDVEDREVLRLRALDAWQMPLLRGVLAILWLVTAALSAGLHPLHDSLSRLAPFGLTGGLALFTLAGASLLDAGMGWMTLFRPGRRLWLAQGGLVLIYTLLIAWQLPQFLSDPFGPVLKNLAVLALLLQLWSRETRT
jgi:uncharacterized protein YbjT (DUF2867 family)